MFFDILYIRLDAVYVILKEKNMAQMHISKHFHFSKYHICLKATG